MKIDGKQKHRINVGGTFSFDKLSNEQKSAVFNRLAEKDPVIKEALSGAIPGIKINGKSVTRDSIKELEKEASIMNKEKVQKVIGPKQEKKKVKKYSKKEIFDMNKSEQIDILKGFKIESIPKLEKNRVKKILELQ